MDQSHFKQLNPNKEIQFNIEIRPSLNSLQETYNQSPDPDQEPQPTISSSNLHDNNKVFLQTMPAGTDLKGHPMKTFQSSSTMLKSDFTQNHRPPKPREKSAQPGKKRRTIKRASSTITFTAPGVVEDATQSLLSLKLDYSNLKQDNIRYKTRNSQLETLINTLYDDLHEQKEQIDKFFAGKGSLKTDFYQSSLAQGLKRQIREERTMNKLLSDELDQLKKSVRLTNEKELTIELKLYQKECVRLRKILTKEIKSGEKAMVSLQSNHNLEHAGLSEEEKRAIALSLAKKDKEISECYNTIANLKLEMEKKEKNQKKQEVLKMKAQTDLAARQVFLIKAKGDQIKMLSEQLASCQQKIQSHDLISRRNMELTRQNLDLQNALSRFEKVLPFQRSLSKEIDNISPTKLSERIPPTAPKLSNTEQRLVESDPLEPIGDAPALKRKITLTEQQNKPLLTQFISQDMIRKSSNKLEVQCEFLDVQISNVSAEQTSQEESMKFFKRIQLTQIDLLCGGILNFKALVEKTEQPKSDNQRAFFNQYARDIERLIEKIQAVQIDHSLMEKVLACRFNLDQSLGLDEQLKVCASKWAGFCEELHLCKLLIQYGIPCIEDNRNLSIDKFYEQFQRILSTNSPVSSALQFQQQSSSERNSVSSQIQSSPKIIGIETACAAPTIRQSSNSSESYNSSPLLQAASVKNSVEGLSAMTSSGGNPSTPAAKVIQKVKHSPTVSLSQQSKQQQLFYVRDETHLYASSASGAENVSDAARSEKILSIIDQSQNNATQVRSSGAFQSFNGKSTPDEASISEDQMLDIAEQILNELAQKLIQNEWSVQDVFGQPEQITKMVKDNTGALIKVLSPEMFLARVYQVGLTNLSRLQVACLMKVLGKPELDDSIRYNELEMLMDNFGVQKQTDLTIEQQSSHLSNASINRDDNQRPNFQFKRNFDQVDELDQSSQEQSQPTHQYESDPEQHSSQKRSVSKASHREKEPSPEPNMVVLMEKSMKQKLNDIIREQTQFDVENSSQDFSPQNAMIQQKPNFLGAVHHNQTSQDTFNPIDASRAKLSNQQTQNSLTNAEEVKLVNNNESPILKKRPSLKSIESSSWQRKSVQVDEYYVSEEQKKIYSKEIHPKTSAMQTRIEDELHRKFEVEMKSLPKFSSSKNVALKFDALQINDSEIQSVQVKSTLAQNIEEKLRLEFQLKLKEATRDSMPPKLRQIIEEKLQKEFIQKLDQANQTIERQRQMLIKNSTHLHQEDTKSSHDEGRAQENNFQLEQIDESSFQNDELNYTSAVDGTPKNYVLGSIERSLQQRFQTMAQKSDEFNSSPMRNTTKTAALQLFQENSGHPQQSQATNFQNLVIGTNKQKALDHEILEHQSNIYGSEIPTPTLAPNYYTRIDSEQRIRQTHQTQSAIGTVIETSTTPKVEETKTLESVDQAQPARPIDQRAANRQAVKNQGQQSGVFRFFSGLLEKARLSALVKLIEDHAYPQQVKTKSRTAETNIINEETLFALLAAYTDRRLSQDEVVELQDCVKLTPKFPHLYTTKLLIALLTDIGDAQ